MTKSALAPAAVVALAFALSTYERSRRRHALAWAISVGMSRPDLPPSGTAPPPGGAR